MPDSQGPSMAFYGKWGGLAQSTKSLSEMVKENPYFQYGGGGEVTKIWSFSTFRQFVLFDRSPKVNIINISIEYFGSISELLHK